MIRPLKIIEDGKKLNISESDNALDLDLVREVVPYFWLKEKEADTIINTI